MRAELPVSLAPAAATGSAASPRRAPAPWSRASSGSATSWPWPVAGAAVAWWRFDAGMPPSALTALLLGCVLTPQVLPWFCDYAGGRLVGLGWQIPRLLAGWAATIALVIAFLYAIKAAGDVSRLWVGFWFVDRRRHPGRHPPRHPSGPGRGFGRPRAHPPHRRDRHGRAAGADRRALGRPPTLPATLPPASPRSSISTAPWRAAGRAASPACAASPSSRRRSRPASSTRWSSPCPPGPATCSSGALRNLRHLGVDVGWVPDLPGRARAGARHRPDRRRAAGPAARAPARRLALAAQGGRGPRPGRHPAAGPRTLDAR